MSHRGSERVRWPLGLDLRCRGELGPVEHGDRASGVAAVPRETGGAVRGEVQAGRARSRRGVRASAATAGHGRWIRPLLAPPLHQLPTVTSLARTPQGATGIHLPSEHSSPLPCVSEGSRKDRQPYPLMLRLPLTVDAPVDPETEIAPATQESRDGAGLEMSTPRLPRVT